MNATQRKRLLKLADFIVERVPYESFDMNSFGSLGTLDLNPNICNTAGCALGWCTVLFKHLGVRDHGFPAGPVYKGFRNYNMAEPLFGLTHDQSISLFACRSFPPQTAKQVRRDILRFVAKLDKEKNAKTK